MKMDGRVEMCCLLPTHLSLLSCVALPFRFLKGQSAQRDGEAVANAANTILVVIFFK